MKAGMTIFKGNLGTGILALPYAIYIAGLVVGPLCIFLMGCIALCCMHCLIRGCHIQRARAYSIMQGEVDMHYDDLLAWTLRTAHPRLRGWPAAWGKRFVNGCLMVSQLGFCSVYIVFVSENLKQAVEEQTSTQHPLWQYQLGVSLFLMVYSQMRGLNKVAPFSVIANVLNVTGLGLIFVSLFSSPLPDISARPLFAGWALMPTFFGIVVFTFEGISLVLPVERQARNKAGYSSPCGVLTLSMTVVICLYTAMGFYGYLVYGPETKPSITLNLPSSPWYYYSVKPLMALVMFMSFHLQLFVPVQLTMTWLVAKKHWNSDEHRPMRHKAEALIRLAFFSLTLVISMVVPNLDLLISFIGAFASSFLALILPSFIYLTSLMTEPRRPSIVIIVFLVAIITLGLCGFVIGTYTSVLAIAQSF